MRRPTVTENADNAPQGACCWCAKVRPFAYVDALGLGWCADCYQDTFLENFTPDPSRRIPPA